jgi:misacylated tRNA(Ala) deacylase
VVTGGNMEPLSGRLDFEFPDPPEGFAAQLQDALNAEVAADRPIRVSFVPRGEAVLDDSLIRTKVSLVPESVREVRVVDIEGLDRQADGGTHVARTGEVGGLRVAKVQSKGKGFRRVRLEVLDAPPD